MDRHTYYNEPIEESIFDDVAHSSNRDSCKLTIVGYYPEDLMDYLILFPTNHPNFNEINTFLKAKEADGTVIKYQCEWHNASLSDSDSDNDETSTYVLYYCKYEHAKDIKQLIQYNPQCPLFEKTNSQDSIPYHKGETDGYHLLMPEHKNSYKIFTNFSTCVKKHETGNSKPEVKNKKHQTIESIDDLVSQIFSIEKNRQDGILNYKIKSDLIACCSTLTADEMASLLKQLQTNIDTQNNDDIQSQCSLIEQTLAASSTKKTIWFDNLLAKSNDVGALYTAIMAESFTLDSTDNNYPLISAVKINAEKYKNHSSFPQFVENLNLIIKILSEYYKNIPHKNDAINNVYHHSIASTKSLLDCANSIELLSYSTTKVDRAKKLQQKPNEIRDFTSQEYQTVVKIFQEGITMFNGKSNETIDFRKIHEIITEKDPENQQRYRQDNIIILNNELRPCLAISGNNQLYLLDKLTNFLNTLRDKENADDKRVYQTIFLFYLELLQNIFNENLLNDVKTEQYETSDIFEDLSIKQLLSFKNDQEFTKFIQSTYQLYEEILKFQPKNQIEKDYKDVALKTISTDFNRICHKMPLTQEDIRSIAQLISTAQGHPRLKLKIPGLLMAFLGLALVMSSIILLTLSATSVVGIPLVWTGIAVGGSLTAAGLGTMAGGLTLFGAGCQRGEARKMQKSFNQVAKNSQLICNA